MASDASPLWSSSLHREALDLMVAVWPKLSGAGQIGLVDRIVAGPPMPDDQAEDQDSLARRKRWFDRRIFERLSLIDRLEVPPLPHAGKEMLASLLRFYPHWRIQEGDRAHFSSWMESYDGLVTDRTLEELEALSGTALVDALRAKGQDRDGRLSVWGQLVRRRPGRGIGLLSNLFRNPEPDDAAIWRDTLYGLRDAMSRQVVARRVVDVLIRAPDVTMSVPALLAPMSDALEAASKQQPLQLSEDRFLCLWDRLVSLCLEEGNEPGPESYDWVARAINKPLGRLTEALLNVMFRRGMKAGEKIPLVFRSRIDRITVVEPENLRLARVILASRLQYLFAIDPDWTHNRLLPHFDWDRSEDEATAMWRAYAWGARINVELWIELSPSLYAAFTPARRQRLDATSESLASFLMVAGVEFPESLVPTDLSRRTIRAMDPRDRSAAVAWLFDYVASPSINDTHAPLGAEQVGRQDRVWDQRVRPWLDRVWPRDAKLVTPEISEQFSLLAIATHSAFPTAVDFLLPYIIASENWRYVVHTVLHSRHPTDAPDAVLRLLDKVIARGRGWYGNDLRQVLDRVVAADPGLRQHSIYRSLDSALRAVG